MSDSIKKLETDGEKGNNSDEDDVDDSDSKDEESSLMMLKFKLV